MSIPDDIRSVLAGLPASYLALVLLNACMTGLLLYVLHSVALAKTEAVRTVMIACTEALKASSPAGRDTTN